MQNTTSPIEQIGTEPFSASNAKQMPVYRAYGFTGKWSSSTMAPPAQGERVRINFNELGTGTVVNYFTESGWLGVRVRLDKEPDWRKRQASAGTPAMVFGAELSPI